jgi:hypothetical protein
MPKPGDRTLPKRGPVKPRTPEEQKFIRDELRRSPSRGSNPKFPRSVIKEKKATVAPRRGAR